MKAEYPFNLYMMAPPRREPIDVTQNDNLMVELVAKLKNRNGTAFLPPEGAVANFIAVKPDGHGIVLRSDDPEEPKVTLADDEVRVSLPREALAVTGWIACKIAIQDNDAIASSQEFSLMCNRDLLPEDFTESEAYQSIIYYLEHLGEREAEFDDMKEQFYQAINGLTEDDEVINARIDGPYATTFDTLKLRLDHMSGLLKGVVDGDFESRVSALEEEVETARGEFDALADRLDEMDVGIEGNASDLENTKLKVIRLEEEVETARGEFDALVDRLDDTDGRIADNAGEIDSAKVKILQLEQENKQLKKIVEDSNPTQSPRVSSVGYGVVSLPKNAANGQVSASIYGNSIFNYANNGVDYANWSVTGAGSTKGANGIRLVAQGTSDRAILNINMPSMSRTLIINIKDTNITGDFLLRNNTGSWNTLPKTKGIHKIYSTNIHETRLEFVLSTSCINGEYLDFEVYGLLEGDYTNDNSVNYPMSYGTKSTVGAMRLKSVSADETETSTAYVVAKNDEGNIEELRSLPNGVKDEVNVADGKLIKRVSDEFTLPMSGWRFDIINKQGFVVLINNTTLPNFATQIYGEFRPATGMVVNNSNFPAYTTTSVPAIRDNADTECIATGYRGVNIYIVVHPDKYDKTQDSAGANAWVNENMQGVTLTYQLAEPVEIPVQVSGSIVSYPSGTIYVEPFVADAGVYADKIEVLHQDLPIKAIEKVSKVDFMTGVETELDIEDIVIAEDKLSFTHPDLTSGDIVFFVYEYDRESTVGETEIEYYDSRYVIKDSVTGKFYKWHIAVAGGVPSIELVEV